MKRIIGVGLALLLLALPVQAQVLDFLNEDIVNRLVKHGENFDSEHKFGTNADIDTTSDPEDVWVVGGLYTFPSAADTTTIVSDSADDAAAGTGSQTVVVEGLDGSWNQQTETVTMDGTDAVTLANTYLRVNRAYSGTPGSGGLNAGVITIAVDGTTVAAIAAGAGQTQQAVFTVANNYTQGYLIQIGAALDKALSARTVTLHLLTRTDGGSIRMRHHWELNSTGTSVTSVTFPYWMLLPPKTDVRIEIHEVSANDTSVSAWFDIALRH